MLEMTGEYVILSLSKNPKEKAGFLGYARNDGSAFTMTERRDFSTTLEMTVARSQ